MGTSPICDFLGAVPSHATLGRLLMLHCRGPCSHLRNLVHPVVSVIRTSWSNLNIIILITIFVLAEIGGINFIQATRSNNFTFSTTTEGLIKENFMFVSFPHSEQVETSSVLLTDIDGSVLFMWTSNVCSELAAWSHWSHRYPIRLCMDSRCFSTFCSGEIFPQGSQRVSL